MNEAGRSLIDVWDVDPLRALDATELAKLQPHADRRTLDDGAVLVPEGTAADEAFVLTRGTALSRHGTRVRRIDAGTFVGELAVLDRRPATATVTACGRDGIDVVALRRDGLDVFLAEPVLAWELIRALAPGGADTDRPDQGSPARLTPAERRVARLVAKGLRNHEVAEALYVAPSTVESHLKQIRVKLGIRSRVDLAIAMATVPSAA